MTHASEMLATIASTLGRRDISISSVLQHEPTGDAATEGLPAVITTHPAQEGNLRSALRVVDKLDCVKAPTVCIRMIEEHAERIG